MCELYVVGLVSILLQVYLSENQMLTRGFVLKGRSLSLFSASFSIFPPFSEMYVIKLERKETERNEYFPCVSDA